MNRVILERLEKSPVRGWPINSSIIDYESTIKAYVDAIPKECVRGILQIGSVSHPGISDIDFFEFIKIDILDDILLELQKGDTIYTFSDGYQDQFGGDRDEKFMSKRFRQLLLDIQGKSMKKQKQILVQTIEKWKGDRTQLDDILVIGVRV
ncbi:MAG: SpoIIE family protein phosphatase [Bacteroidetes bacterium]|nr:SpoIIE family protein phosphatase [Bacteroidota bacterium]